MLVSFGNLIDEAINRRVLLLHEALQQSSFEGFVESVPAYASLAVFYDVPVVRSYALTTAAQFVKEYLQRAMEQLDAVHIPTPAIIKIPVCYDTIFGPDIHELAAIHQLSIHEVIKLHTAVTYRVYMIGFMPGFAYMGTVDQRIATPRKSQPSIHVPAGSVGIAGAQTGIYPVDSPGGWQIIGRAPVKLFDLHKDTPCLFSPGDQVQFFSIDKNEFDAYVD